MTFKTTLYACALVLCTTSCEKLLDKEPVDSLSIEETFKDLAGTKTALAGAYTSLLDIYELNAMVYPDLAGGNIKYSKTTNLRLDDVYHFTQLAEDCSMNAAYSSLYSVLNNVNNILKYAPRLTDATAQQVNRLEAEARCLRALLHFSLVRLYARPYNYTTDSSHAGVVVNLQPLLVSDPLPARSTIDATYDAITTDLETAVSLFANSTALLTGGYGANYWNANSARALLSKVYLYKGNWQQAYNYANTVITTGGYTLLTNANYVSSWSSNTPSTESIFEIAVEPTRTATSLGAYYGNTGNSYQQYAATRDLLDLYSATDVRGKTTLFNNANGSAYYFTRKYEKDGANASPVKLLRLSEIYLIRAEAAAALGLVNEANADLETIRKRGDATAVALGLTGDVLHEAIATERRKELAFEGNLIFDLARRKKGVSRADCTAQTCTVEYSDYRMVLPIPKISVTVNTNIKQNDKY